MKKSRNCSTIRLFFLMILFNDRGIKIKKKEKIFNFFYLYVIYRFLRKEIYIWIWKEYENSM